MKSVYAATVAACLFLSNIGGAQPTSTFEFRRSLKGEPSGETLGVVLLDSDVFRESKGDLSDVRLFDESDSEVRLVPFLIQEMEPEKAALPARTIPSEIIDFSEASDGSIEVVVKLEEGEGRAASMSISTPLRNFEKQVSIEASNDEATWKPLLDDGVIFDFEKFIDFRRSTLSLPENNFRYFRIRVSEASDEMSSMIRSIRKSVSDRSGTTVEESFQIESRPFRVDALTFKTAKRSVEERIGNIVSYPATILSSSFNDEEKRSEIILDIENCPVDSLWLESKDRNYRRRIEVQIPNRAQQIENVEEVDSWRTVKRGAIHHFQLGNFSDENPEIDFSLPTGQDRPQWIRVLIESGDSPPLSVSAIKAFGKVFQMRFLTAEGRKYAAYFGAKGMEVPAPQFDLAAIRIADREGFEKTRLFLQPTQKNPEFAESESNEPLLNQSWMLWIAIAAAVACLILVLVRAGGKIQELE